MIELKSKKYCSLMKGMESVTHCFQAFVYQLQGFVIPRTEVGDRTAGLFQVSIFQVSKLFSIYDMNAVLYVTWLTISV